MTARKHSILNIVVTGMIAVLLVSLGLFWARWLCNVSRGDLLPPAARTATVDLSRFLEPLAQGDPNRITPWKIEASIPPVPSFLLGLGALQYAEARIPGGFSWSVYAWKPQRDESRRYYDSSLGLIVYQGEELSHPAEGKYQHRYFTLYAGPEGVGERPDAGLGRFSAPIVDRFASQPQIVYDRGARRFFSIDWSHGGTIRKGPQLRENDEHQPLQIRVLSRNLQRVPLIPVSSSGRDHSIALSAYFSIPDRVLVLDASGRIDLLDARTLAYTGVAGRLTAPTPVFGSRRQTRPEDVLAYEVSPFSIPRRDAKEWGQNYAGCVVATVGREGLAMRLEVYDANGHQALSDETCVHEYAESSGGKIVRSNAIPSAKAMYAGVPGAGSLTLLQFALESLHPPVFLAASYLSAPHLDAGAGYRSVFPLPDSFVAMMARNAGAGAIERPCYAFLLACPAVLLALLLAALVARHGKRMGLSKNGRRAWVIGTVLFGLPAYLTYRLTRPKATLVTCANCGVGRRPDLDRCQHCGSPWTVPELTPPAWRVVDAGSPAALGWETGKTQPGAAVPAEENSFFREPPADSQVQ
jgi:hypothetical protein